MNKRIKKKKKKQALQLLFKVYPNFYEDLKPVISAMYESLHYAITTIAKKCYELALNEECKTDNNIPIGIAEKSAHENIE